MKHKLNILILSLIYVLVCACSDKDLEDTKEFEWDSNYLELSRGYCYTEIPSSLLKGAEGTRVTTDAPYIFLSDSIYNGSKLFAEIEQNDEEHAREGRIFFSNAESSDVELVIYVKQKGKDSMNDGDSYCGSLMRTYGVGYGYDAMGEYASYASVRDAIISLPALHNYERTHHTAIIVDDLKPVTEMKIINGNSSQELSKAYGFGAGIELDAGVFAAEVNARYDHQDMRRNEYSFCTIFNNYSLVSRHIDPRTIAHIAQEDSTIFTVGFRAALDKIRRANNNEVSNAVDELFSHYGTHFMYQASLGGRLVFTSTFERAGLSSEDNLSVSAEASFLCMCGFSTTDNQKNTYSRVQDRHSRSLRVFGGDVNICTEIIHSGDDDIPNSIIDRWYKSIRIDKDNVMKSNVELIDHKLYPIYELIYDTELKNKIKRRLNLELDYAYSILPRKEEAKYFYLDVIRSNIDNHIQLYMDNDRSVHVESINEKFRYGKREYFLRSFYPVLAGEVRNEGIAFDMRNDSIYQILWNDSFLKIKPIGVNTHVTRVYYNNGDIALAPSEGDSLYSLSPLIEEAGYFCWDGYYKNFFKVGPYVLLEGPVCQPSRNAVNYVHDVKLDLLVGVSPVDISMLAGKFSSLEDNYRCFSTMLLNNSQYMFKDMYVVDTRSHTKTYRCTFWNPSTWRNINNFVDQTGGTESLPLLLYRTKSFRY